MTVTNYYHYTDEEGSRKIIRSGKILASLSFTTSDDAGYGNGVYLTTLNPDTHSKHDIAMNNWVKTTESFINKTKYYFVLTIPDSDIKDVSSNGRVIFLLGRKSDLSLHKYHWWLQSNDNTGKIISSYKYTLSSYGPASLVPRHSARQASPFGDYIMSDEAVNGRPLYKNKDSENYLFMSNHGSWMVSDEAGDEAAWFHQLSNYSLGPTPNLPWVYSDGDDDQWFMDDKTLKMQAWQK